jgi:nucleoside-diphosphate-sugar epimerase
MANIDPQAPVMVTGATGYVAGWLVKLLLENGHTVHAAVRDPSNTQKRSHLDALAARGPGTIRYFKADLLQPGSYAEAMAGCELVFHTASPFIVSVKDPQKELIEPAQLGTRNVLEEANRTPSVKRVVLTSSCAAIYGDNADVKAAPNGILTEEIWNTSSNLAHQPYSYSKTLAEKEAWSIAQKQSRWDLVVMNPCLVMGPGLRADPTSESFAILKPFADGTYRTGIVRYGMGVVDVRDVAEAHYRGGYTPSAKGRHILAGADSDLADWAPILKPRFGQKYPLPSMTVPKWLVWLIGPLTNRTLNRKTVTLNIGIPWKADASKSKRELGMSYRPLETTLVEMFEQMEQAGAFTKRN